jgi:hypothetical protein
LQYRFDVSEIVRLQRFFLQGEIPRPFGLADRLGEGLKVELALAQRHLPAAAEVPQVEGIDPSMMAGEERGDVGLLSVGVPDVEEQEDRCRVGLLEQSLDLGAVVGKLLAVVVLYFPRFSLLLCGEVQ